MHRERYPGERVGLRSFLSDLLPLVETELGRDSLVFHAVRRALNTNKLDDLRRARRMFNLLPRATKRRLSSGIVASQKEALQRRERRKPSEPQTRPQFVSFEHNERGRPRVRLSSDDEAAHSAIQVLVRPGTLPSTFATELRKFADMVERDRRILSDRFWHKAETEGAEAADDQAAGSGNGQLDRR